MRGGGQRPLEKKLIFKPHIFRGKLPLVWGFYSSGYAFLVLVLVSKTEFKVCLNIVMYINTKDYS